MGKRRHKKTSEAVARRCGLYTG